MIFYNYIKFNAARHHVMTGCERRAQAWGVLVSVR